MRSIEWKLIIRIYVAIQYSIRKMCECNFVSVDFFFFKLLAFFECEYMKRTWTLNACGVCVCGVNWIIELVVKSIFGILRSKCSNNEKADLKKLMAAFWLYWSITTHSISIFFLFSVRLIMKCAVYPFSTKIKFMHNWKWLVLVEQKCERRYGSIWESICKQIDVYVMIFMRTFSSIFKC